MENNLKNNKCVLITESLCYAPKTLKVNYASIKQIYIYIYIHIYKEKLSIKVTDKAIIGCQRIRNSNTTAW